MDYYLGILLILINSATDGDISATSEQMIRMIKFLDPYFSSYNN